MGDRLIAIDGHFVSERISRVVEAIREYDERIEVQWLPPEERVLHGFQDAFRLIYNGPNGPEPMFNVRSEEEFDLRVLKKIIHNDQDKNNIKLSDYEQWLEAERRVERQRFLDQMEEANDLAVSILRSPLHTYRHGNLVIRDRGDNVG